MKLQKYIYILLILLFCMISISAVSAADETANDVISTDTNDNIILDETINEDVSNANDNNDEIISEEIEDLDLDGVGEKSTLKEGGTSPTGSFSDLNTAINGNSYNEIKLTSNYTYKDSEGGDSGFKDGIAIGRNLIIDGQGHTIDGAKKARIFYVSANSVTFKNINFINGWSQFGGAIYGNSKIINCTFENNGAQYFGGAIYTENTTINDSKFIKNYAHESGGAIYGNRVIYGNDAINGNITISNSQFLENLAFGMSVDIIEKGGGAIYCTNGEVFNSSFIGNSMIYTIGGLDKGGGAIHFEEKGIVKSCLFMRNSVQCRGAAIWSRNPTIINSIFINNTSPLNDVISINSEAPYAGTNNWFGNNATNFNETPTQNENLICDSWLFLNATASPNIIEQNKISDIAFKLYVYNNTTKKVSEYDNALLPELNLTVNASAGTLKKNVLKLGDSVKINGTEKGTITITASFEYDDVSGDSESLINRVIFSKQSTQLKVTDPAPKKATKLTASGITTTYNVNKNLVITLKDSAGKALSGLKITVDLNGAKKYTTDSNGQVKIAVGKLVPKTYTAKISFAGNDKYNKSNTTAKVTVKKANPAMTAKAKTFKFEDKTKKYTITLKDNKGNVLKNKKVTLKVNGKTYTATTNSKGVATFKLTKLTKKGTYTAVITYAGDKYYNKLTKKPKITVKAPAWKTVARGSKDNAMVKKIQQALKNNGYYLNYKGRYLKVDGIFEEYTEMAVKQFQKAKNLKVTGKVDYDTAKKLKIVS